MSNVANQLDEITERIMSGLKDFQIATVNRVAELFKNGQNRVLVSDEVGLGKTLIARGTVAKVAQMQRDSGDDLVKVVYICSNGAIAGQNLAKLRLTKDVRMENVGSSRLSMQHLNIFKQENDKDLLSNYIQLIPMTPDTSFRMTSGSGTAGERALMYAILVRLPELYPYREQLDVAMQDDAYVSWNSWVKQAYEKEVVECDVNSNGRYLRYMLKKIKKELHNKQDNGITYLDELIDLCKRIKNNNNKRVSEKKIIGKLRVIFARVSIKRLRPDLVIMDEFQRFKYLIDTNPENETEASMLARNFFGMENLRILLLSATPYKMYSTLEEIDEEHVDEHYSEFLKVMEFLNINPDDFNNFSTIWNNYSVQLKEFTKNKTTIIQAKKMAEDAMYKSVCRTERSFSDETDMIDDHYVKTHVQVSAADIQSYIEVQKLLDSIGASFHVPVDYIKSTPYLLSFMNDYQLKKYIEKYYKANPEEFNSVYGNEYLWLRKNRINNYSRIPNNNARLEYVMNETLSHGEEKLLWVPPTKPYYGLQGPFKDKQNFSKTMIFSSWEMVPRMIASMLSYEAERKNAELLKQIPDYSEKEVKYFTEDNEKRFPSQRLNFSVRQGVASRMTLFCLIYPSETLASFYDPLVLLNYQLSLKEIKQDVAQYIRRKLHEYKKYESGNREDAKWYYLAPLLMDSDEYAKRWFDSAERLIDYDNSGSANRKSDGFTEHLNTLKRLYDDVKAGRYDVLGIMPEDLVDVLADMAIGSPAICLYRTFKLFCGDNIKNANYYPSQLARIFLNRMNTVESTAVVEIVCGRKNDEAHWRNLLTYDCQGCLQSVFDEYAHMIVSGLDKDEKLMSELARQMTESFNIRTTTYTIDTPNAFKEYINKGKRKDGMNIRTHFAVAFSKGKQTESDADRKKTVRNAFNSPFRPFVLASTSIGQEGLDFHYYCRKIVHWNLPSNPIDLEQREGRINRYECLAIRQNIAKRYGNIIFKDDIWKEMFEEAEKVEKVDGASDLIPYWKVKNTDDMVKIERHVPMYPYSKDENQYERLIKILSLYRLTLGQPRQEELLEYIFSNDVTNEELDQLFINLSPYYK